MESEHDVGRALGLQCRGEHVLDRGCRCGAVVAEDADRGTPREPLHRTEVAYPRGRQAIDGGLIADLVAARAGLPVARPHDRVDKRGVALGPVGKAVERRRVEHGGNVDHAEHLAVIHHRPARRGLVLDAGGVGIAEHGHDLATVGRTARGRPVCQCRNEVPAIAALAG